MEEGRVRERWNHTAHILAVIAEANRDPNVRKDSFSAADFDPFRDTKPPDRIMVKPSEVAELLKRAKKVTPCKGK